MRLLSTCLTRLVSKSVISIESKCTILAYKRNKALLKNFFRTSQSRPTSGIERQEIMNPIINEDFHDVDILNKYGISSELSDPLKTVFICSESNILKVSLLYDLRGSLKTFNLIRPIDESVSVSTQRLKLNIEKFTSRRAKKVSENQLFEFDISLEKDGRKFVDEKNDDAWVNGAILRIDQKIYNVARDFPQIKDIHIPKVIISGFPLLVRVDLQGCNFSTSKFFWFRSITSNEKKMLSQAEVDERVILYNKMYWYLVSKDLQYFPTDDDINHRLVLVSVPSDGIKQGPIQYHRCAKEVLPNPGEFPFKRRQILTQTKVSDLSRFRIVTYNILADVYADSTYSRNHLFKHCDRTHLDVNYRRLLLVNEIQGYNADIICLQEVDRKEFIFTYQTYFGQLDYECVFAEKGNTSEGLACLINKQKFKLIDSHKTILSQLIDPDYVPEPEENTEEDPSRAEKTRSDENRYPTELVHFILQNRGSDDAISCLKRFSDIRRAIEASPLLKKRFCQRKTVVQTTLLESKHQDNSFILIVNTHLYFAPDADHVRLLQGALCVGYMEYMKDFYTRMIEKSAKVKPVISIVFCGDLNSTPNCGLFKLLTEGYVPKDIVDWSSNSEEKVENLDLRNDILFIPAYENIKYTNFTPLFNGCLDYIYYDKKNLTCESVVPLPSHEEITRTGGIPSNVFPSDHIALIANLRITN